MTGITAGRRRLVIGLAALAATGALAGCGAASDPLATGCFTAGNAVLTINTALDAIRAGTATDADTIKAFGKAANDLTDASSFFPAGELKDLTATAATALGRARVSETAGDSSVVDQDAATAALTKAAPLCVGHRL